MATHLQPPTGRIVVFGATGFTGALVARALVARGIRPVLAGRRGGLLHALRDEIGAAGVQLADAARPETVRALVDAGDVLATTVGPFARHGLPAVSAAVSAGAHYLDPAGEGQFVRQVLTGFGPEAQSAGCALLPAFGFESVPGNLAGALALDQAGEAATRVEVLYLCDPGVSSGGTRASAAGVTLERGFAWQQGTLVDRRVGARARRFVIDGQRVLGLSIPSSEHLTLPASFPRLRSVDVYLGGFGMLAYPLRVVAAVSSRVGAVTMLRRVAEAANRCLFRPSSGGPSEARRAQTITYTAARAYDRHDQLMSEVVFSGPDPYQLTADLFAWAAERILAGELRAGGGLGPVAAFGLSELARAAGQLGLRRLGDHRADTPELPRRPTS